MKLKKLARPNSATLDRTRRFWEVIAAFGDLGVNFNPPGTPYQGDEDIDQDDQYPSLIKGIIATTRDINYHPDETTIEGVIVCGHKFRLKDNATLNLKYDSAIKDNPPPGFRHRPVIKTVPGSWKQVVN